MGCWNTRMIPPGLSGRCIVRLAPCRGGPGRGTRKQPEVVKWLERHPRFHLHFTPTSCALNQVERFFAEITRKHLRRGIFRSVTELEFASTATSPTTMSGAKH
jgi:hypothetical protein